MSLFHKDDVRIVNVDSSQRLSGTSTNFTINLNLPNYVQEFDRVAVNQISIPRSWYDVESGYNTFVLKEGTSSQTITIPAGMYNVNTLATTIATQLNSASVLNGNSYTYTVAYPNSSLTVNNNLYTYTCSSSAKAIQFIFTTNLYQQMGFAQNTTNTFGGGSPNTLTSVNSISISYINRLFLYSNCCNTAQNGYLQEILIAGQFPSTSFIYYEAQNFDINSKEFTNPQNNAFDFALYDRYGNIVNLHGLEIVFSLIFYKKNRTDELHFDYIKMKNLEKLL
jgi:hypothetical protein